MNIQVEHASENKDGSVNVNIHFDDGGLKYLIQHAVIDILSKYAEQNPIRQPDEETNVRSKRKSRTKNESSI